MYQNSITLYLYEAQRVSGDTPPIIRSLKLHWQPLVVASGFSYVGGCWTCSCWTLSCTAWQRPPTTRTDNLPHMKNQRLPVQFGWN